MMTDEQIHKIAAIPKDNLPEERIADTAKQIQQFYNSEQWKEVAESINKMWNSLLNTFKPIFERVRRNIEIAYLSVPEIKKCYGIYKRTKKRRIKKKQINRIKKLLRR